MSNKKNNMPRFKIPFKIQAYVYITVEAEDIDEAKEKAQDEFRVDHYCGNGGCDKMIGVIDGDDTELSIECYDEYGKIIEDEIEKLDE